MVENTTERPTDEEYVLRFHASWCGPCNSFEPVYKQASEETTIPFYDADVEQSLSLAREFGVTSIPAAFYVKSNVRKRLNVTSNASDFNKQLVV